MFHSAQHLGRMIKATAVFEPEFGGRVDRVDVGVREPSFVQLEWRYRRLHFLSNQDSITEIGAGRSFDKLRMTPAPMQRYGRLIVTVLLPFSLPVVSSTYTLNPIEEPGEPRPSLVERASVPSSNGCGPSFSLCGSSLSRLDFSQSPCDFSKSRCGSSNDHCDFSKRPCDSPNDLCDLSYLTCW